MEEARKRGLLVGKGGFYGNVIRMSPPLNIGKADVDEAARILDESFAALKKLVPPSCARPGSLKSCRPERGTFASRSRFAVEETSIGCNGPAAPCFAV